MQESSGIEHRTKVWREKKTYKKKSDIGAVRDKRRSIDKQHRLTHTPETRATENRHTDISLLSLPFLSFLLSGSHAAYLNTRSSSRGRSWIRHRGICRLEFMSVCDLCITWGYVSLANYLITLAHQQWFSFFFFFFFFGFLALFLLMQIMKSKFLQRCVTSVLRMRVQKCTIVSKSIRG